MTLKRLMALLFTFLLASQAWAVELKGQIKGTVVDTDGLAVPGAVVIAESPSLQGQAGDQTDAEGRFHVVGLPPGEYTVTVTKPGFQEWKTTGIRLMAGATITLEVTLQVAVAGEEIVVEEEAPVVDVTSTRTGAYLTKEMMRDIPNAGRDYQTAVSLAPGVVGGGNPNAHGSFSHSNQYYIDGVNTTDPLTNTFSMNMNFDAIEEIQVITGGLDAEYGRSLGAAVNIVTRSGGNEFEGDAQLLYSSNATRVYKPLPGEDPDSMEYADQSLAVNLSGPILLDKLWYFTGLQLNYYKSTIAIPEGIERPNGEPMAPRIWTSAYLFGKLTWKPTPNHQLWVHYQANPTQILNSTQSIYTLPSAEDWWRQGGWLASVGHQWTPTRNTVVEQQGYYQMSYITVMPMEWRDCEEWADDGTCKKYSGEQYDHSWYAYDPDGFDYGPDQYAYFTRRYRASYNASVTQYFDFLGEHEAKTGVSAEFLRSYTIVPGVEDGLEYWTYGDGSPTDLSAYHPYLLLKYDSNLEADLRGLLGAWYVQDVWHPWPRLTVRPGVRFDYSKMLNDTGRIVFSSLTAAPRFGLAYDVKGDGSTKAHAYYGRFYDAGYLGVSDILTDKPAGYSYYYWDDTTGDWSTEPAMSVAPNFLCADDLVNPYADEFNIGFSQDLGDDWGMDVTLVYKESHNFWEDDEVNLIWNEDGSDVIGYRDGESEAIYRFRTPDETWSQYTSLEFTVYRQFTEKWGLIATYTWSHAYGTQDSDMATGYFDIPEQRQYEKGILGYDVPHNLKVSGSYRDPGIWPLGARTDLGYLLGWDFQLRSGYPYRRSYYNAYWDSWMNLGDDGETPDRLPAYSRTNLKAGLSLSAGRTQWDLTVECFNVFNSRTVVGVNTVYDDQDGNIYVDENGDILYGTPTYRQEPRYFQLGLRGEF